MADYYSLKVNYLKKSTANSVVIGFDIPSDVKNKWKFNKKILLNL